LATGSDGAIAVTDIGHWIRSQRLAGRSEVRLHSPSAPEYAALFPIVLAELVGGFGEPDTWVGGVAAWDFDYYRLSLQVEPRGIILALDRGDNADGSAG
jgi:hypothetical protein